MLLIIRGQTNVYLSGSISLNVLYVFMFYVNKGNMITRNKLSQKIQKDVTMNIIRLFSHISEIYGNEKDKK